MHDDITWIWLSRMWVMSEEHSKVFFRIQLLKTKITKLTRITTITTPVTTTQHRELTGGAFSIPPFRGSR